MKRFAIAAVIIAIIAGGYFGYRHYHKKPAPETTRLAPPGEYYIVENFSLVTKDGVSSLRPGRKLRLLEKGGTTWRLTTGKKEFDVPPSNLTRDLDLVDSLLAANRKVETDFVKFSRRTAQMEKRKIEDRIVELEASVRAMEEQERSLKESLTHAQNALAFSKQSASRGFSNLDMKNSEANIARISSQLSSLNARLGKTKADIVALKAEQSKK